MHNLKVENYVLFGGQNCECKPWGTDSQISARDCSKEVREELGYRGVLSEKTR